MLKIRNDVDLKELEKFGFEYYEENNKYFYYGFTRADCFSEIRITVDIETKEILIDFDMYADGNRICDKLYDLIKADLVEKVEG